MSGWGFTRYHDNTEWVWSIRYVSTEDKKKNGAKKANDLVIQRKKPHPSIPGQTVTIPFKVTDNALRIKPEEWSVWNNVCTVKMGIVRHY